VRDADDVDAGADAVGVVHQRGQHHVAAVAAAETPTRSGVELRLRGDPVEQGADVLDRVLALHAVVEVR
jgi:hypothetical protein